MSGGGVVGSDVDGPPSMVLAAVDNWNEGNDYWRIAIGTCPLPGKANSGADVPCSWDDPQVVESGAAVMSGGGVTLADITGDERPEIILSGIDNWDQGNDY